MTRLSLGLHARLRESTRPLHERVEREVALHERIVSLADYRLLLERLHGLHAAYEAAFADLDWPAGLALEDRRKAGWIRADLRHLGADEAALAGLPRPAGPCFPGVEEALGALYVLEGSTLGGQVILRDLSARFGIEPGRGGCFLASYGPRVGAMWRACLAALDAIPAADPRADRVEAGAVETFEAFERWLSVRH